MRVKGRYQARHRDVTLGVIADLPEIDRSLTCPRDHAHDLCFRRSPILGVALPLDGLRLHKDWILDKQRDLELQDFFWAEVLNGDWRPLADEIRRELDGYRGRLGIHGPFWGFNIATQDPDVRAVVQKRMSQGLDVCAHVGATQMVIHSPYTTWDYNNLDYNPGGREQVVERVHKTIGEAVKRAEDMGVTLVIENIEDKDPHIRVDLARSFDSEAVRVSIDTRSCQLRLRLHRCAASRLLCPCRWRMLPCACMYICRTLTAMPTGTGTRVRA